MMIPITIPYLKSNQEALHGWKAGTLEAQRGVLSAKNPPGKEGLQCGIFWNAFALCFRSTDVFDSFPLLNPEALYTIIQH
uniref:Uncharacterized protein n=1 Tax=Monodelphis domestica TaxID=13616 RepID=A0A5F8G5Q5_MONDO